MKILITGSNGFIAGHIINQFKDKHSLTLINRENVNLLDTALVDKFFEDKEFDVVIHTAMTGGRRVVEDTSTVLQDNLTMFFNLLRHKDKYKKFISFGTGAELDRRGNINVTNKLVTSFPIDPYGMSKNITARMMLDLDGFFNIRIFNVFAADGLNDRMIKSNIISYINHNPLVVFQDKYFDFFYMDDLMTILNYYLETDSALLYKDIDAVYPYKLKISDICNLINDLDTHKCEIKILNPVMSTDYYGGRYISYNLPMIGLYESLKIVYNKLRDK